MLSLVKLQRSELGENLVMDFCFVLNKFSTNESTRIYNRSCNLYFGLYLQIPTENHHGHSSLSEGVQNKQTIKQTNNQTNLSLCILLNWGYTNTGRGRQKMCLLIIVLMSSLPKWPDKVNKVLIKWGLIWIREGLGKVKFTQQ